MDLIFLYGLPGVGKLTSVEVLRQLIHNGAFDVPNLPRENLVVDHTDCAFFEAAELIFKDLKTQI